MGEEFQLDFCDLFKRLSAKFLLSQRDRHSCGLVSDINKGRILHKSKLEKKSSIAFL